MYIYVYYFCCVLVGRFDVFWFVYGWFIIIKVIGCLLGGRCKVIVLWVCKLCGFFFFLFLSLIDYFLYLFFKINIYKIMYCYYRLFR